MSRQDNLKNLIATHQRQLQKLKEQQAALGLHTPPYVLTEIEDRAAELEQLQLELQEVQERAAAPAQPIGPQVAAGSTARVDWGVFVDNEDFLMYNVYTIYATIGGIYAGHHHWQS